MIIYLSLGSNIEPRSEYIDRACKMIEERCGHVLRRSSDFYSMPQGYDSDKEYINICLAVSTTLSPMEMLHTTQQIERELGRTIKNSYQDRTIDIDLIEARDEDGHEIRIATEEITLPHPRMQERAFVMVPLGEVAGYR